MSTANGLNNFMATEEHQKSGMKGDSNDETAGKDDSQGVMGTAEVTRDEFGGYCCKRWGTSGD